MQPLPSPPPEAVKVDDIDGILPYLASIDWTEPWLWGLIAFHFVCGLTTGLTALFNKNNIQIPIFFIFLILAYCSEYINEWASMHYQLFARQQYFDSQGLFISTLFSAPLLLNCTVIVASWIYNTYMLMIKMKRAQLVQQARLDHQAKEAKNK